MLVFTILSFINTKNRPNLRLFLTAAVVTVVDVYLGLTLYEIILYAIFLYKYNEAPFFKKPLKNYSFLYAVLCSSLILTVLFILGQISLLGFYFLTEPYLLLVSLFVLYNVFAKSILTLLWFNFIFRAIYIWYDLKFLRSTFILLIPAFSLTFSCYLTPIFVLVTFPFYGLLWVTACLKHT